MATTQNSFTEFFDLGEAVTKTFGVLKTAAQVAAGAALLWTGYRVYTKQPIIPFIGKGKKTDDANDNKSLAQPTVPLLENKSEAEADEIIADIIEGSDA